MNRMKQILEGNDIELLLNEVISNDVSLRVE